MESIFFGIKIVFLAVLVILVVIVKGVCPLLLPLVSLLVHQDLYFLKLFTCNALIHNLRKGDRDIYEFTFFDGFVYTGVSENVVKVILTFL